VVVVIEHFLEWAFVDDGLVAFDARPLFSFECFDRYRTKLDAFDCLPGLLVALENLDAIEAGGGERGHESFLRQRTGNAAAPKLRIVLQAFGNFLVADDIRDHGATADL